jgi:RimJ/RimL family protein N-acetyltransferase
MLPTIETERLLLRQFTLADTDFIIELVNSPGWLQFIGDRNIKTEADAQKYLLNGPLKSYELNGYGLSMVELKEDKIPVGMCGIIKRDTLDHPDIGFAFLPAFTGKGYAVEIAAATIQYAKEILELHPILAITVPDNHASIKLLERIGLRFVKAFYMPGDPDQLFLFSNKAGG